VLLTYFEYECKLLDRSLLLNIIGIGLE